MCYLGLRPRQSIHKHNVITRTTSSFEVLYNAIVAAGASYWFLLDNPDIIHHIDISAVRYI